MQLVEITRSFIWRISSYRYESVDFFCSRKEKCLKKDAVKVSKELYLFCKKEVFKSVKDYKKELMKLEKSLEKAQKKIKQLKPKKSKKKIVRPRPRSKRKLFDNTKEKTFKIID